MLELQKVHSGYGHLRVLFDIDMTLEAGQLVVVLGANGAGKSTLLKTILGVVPATHGDITFLGERVTHLRPHQRVEAGIALSPEGRQVFPNLTVKDNLISGTFGVPRGKFADQVDHVFGMFPRLKERASQRAGSLSGGEQQMLAIGRALMSQPRLLLVDELSLGLAPIIVENLHIALRELCDNGLAVMMVEQIHCFLPGYSDQQLFLERGRFVSPETVEELEEVMALSGTMPDQQPTPDNSHQE